jgi:hypothetical protein
MGRFDPADADPVPSLGEAWAEHRDREANVKTRQRKTIHLRIGLRINGTRKAELRVNKKFTPRGFDPTVPKA